MQHDDIKLTSGAVILAALLLAATDSKADNTLISISAIAPCHIASLKAPKDRYVTKIVTKSNPAHNNQH